MLKMFDTLKRASVSAMKFGREGARNLKDFIAKEVDNLNLEDKAKISMENAAQIVVKGETKEEAKKKAEERANNTKSQKDKQSEDMEL